MELLMGGVAIHDVEIHIAPDHIQIPACNQVAANYIKVAIRSQQGQIAGDRTDGASSVIELRCVSGICSLL